MLGVPTRLISHNKAGGGDLINLARWGFLLVMLNVFAATAVADVPAEYRNAVRNAAELGMTLFVHDAAASRASDVMVERGIAARDRRIRGWLTAIADDRQSVSVIFIGDDSNTPAALYRIAIPMIEGKTEVDELKSPRLLRGSLLSSWRARQNAVRDFESRGDRCSDHYNTVVFPDERTSPLTILVYFLATSEKPDSAMMGGNFRYEFSEDGGLLKSRKAFSESCAELPLVGRSPSLLKIYHPFESAPTEFDVYLSRLHTLQLVVETESSLAWKVDGPKITLLHPAR